MFSVSKDIISDFITGSLLHKHEHCSILELIATNPYLFQQMKNWRELHELKSTKINIESTCF
jgi:hypothetical protein